MGILVELLTLLKSFRYVSSYWSN